MLTAPISRPARRRWGRSLVALALIAITLLIYYSNAKRPKDLNAFDRLLLSVSAPVQREATALYRKGAAFFDRYLLLVDVKSDLLTQQAQVRLLTQRLTRLREVELENQRLRRLLDFVGQQSAPFKTARVIGFDPTSRHRSLRIDRGTDRGVERGMAVAAAEGVVGRVLRAWPRYADVLLVTDPQSGVDALVQRTRARGTVEGGGGEVLRMKYLLRLDEVEEGDIIITSGLDGVFPGGLLVGTVSGLRKQSSGVFQEVQILPAANLHKIEEVVILQGAPAAAELAVPKPEVEESH